METHKFKAREQFPSAFRMDETVLATHRVRRTVPRALGGHAETGVQTQIWGRVQPGAPKRSRHKIPVAFCGGRTANWPEAKAGDVKRGRRGRPRGSRDPDGFGDQEDLSTAKVWWRLECLSFTWEAGDLGQ